MTVAAPSNIGFGTVIGQFLVNVVDGSDPGSDPDFVAALGTIDFTLGAPKLLDATASPNPVTVVRSTITGILDGSGYLCTPDPGDPSTAGARGLNLISTDDADLNPTGWTWTATYRLRDPAGNRLSSPSSHSFALPEGTTVDLTLVQPIESSTGVAVTKGDKGDKGDPGDDGADGTDGIDGTDGTDGARGSKWFVGHGAPGTLVGSLPGDQYLDVDTGDIYTLS